MRPHGTCLLSPFGCECALAHYLFPAHAHFSDHKGAYAKAHGKDLAEEMNLWVTSHVVTFTWWTPTFNPNDLHFTLDQESWSRVFPQDSKVAAALNRQNPRPKFEETAAGHPHMQQRDLPRVSSISR